MAAISLPKAPDGRHTATPVHDSWYTERGSVPANFRRDDHYPIVAVCQTCHGRIRLRERRQMEWAHVEREAQS